MANNPTLKVEISFVSDPLATSPTWVDVSAYVRKDPGVSIRRGRQTELDNFEAGSCVITLSNRDRRFDPSYSAGPYFGNLIPRKQIRVTATWSAVDYVMFRGWVTGWPQSFHPGDGKDATVTIEAVDATAWLSSNRVPIDLVYTYANTTIGSLAFFLRSADRSQWSDATSNGYFARPLSGNARVSSSLSAGSTANAIQFDGTAAWSMNRWTTTAAWSVSFWFNPGAIPSGAISAEIVMSGGDGNLGNTASYYLYWTNANLLEFNFAGGGGGYTQSAIGVFAPNVSHHVVFTKATNSNHVYVNGVDRTGTTSSSPTPDLKLDSFGDWTAGDKSGSLDLFHGSLADVAVFNKELSAAEVLAFYQRSNGYLEEDSATRVTRILDDVGWPATWRSITTTPRATVGELIYNAKTANELLQEVQDTEQGRIFAAKDGLVTFLSRYYVQEVAAGKTVQQIFSDDGGATALPYSTFGFQYNDIDVTNDVTVTTPTTWAKASDATSITANGLQSKKVDTILTTFTAADAMARGLVARGKTAAYRVSPILVYPTRNTTRWDEVLVLDLGHRVSVEQTPLNVGSQNVQEASIEQMEWLITTELWSFIVAGEPVRDVWFIVDDAASLVDGTRVIGY